MKDRRLLPFYVLSLISSVLMIAYFAVSFISIIKVGNIGINIYESAINYKDFKTNPIIMIGLIFNLLATLIIFIVPILGVSHRIKYNVLLFFISLALPLLVFGVIVNATTLPIFKAVNSNLMAMINGNHLVILIQIFLLISTIALNVSTIFYLAIRLFKYSSFKRSKSEDK